MRRRSFPDNRDRLLGQADRLGQFPIRPLRIERQRSLGGGLAIGGRQRQTVGVVQAHREQECLPVVTVEIHHVDPLCPAGQCRPHPVSAVDDGHPGPVHDDRRQGFHDIRERVDMPRVLTRSANHVLDTQAVQGDSRDLRRREGFGLQVTRARPSRRRDLSRQPGPGRDPLPETPARVHPPRCVQSEHDHRRPHAEQPCFPGNVGRRSGQGSSTTRQAASQGTTGRIPARAGAYGRHCIDSALRSSTEQIR